MVGYGIIQIFLSQLPNFHKLWWLSIVAAVMSFAYSFIAVGLSAARIISGVSFVWSNIKQQNTTLQYLKHKRSKRKSESDFGLDREHQKNIHYRYDSWSGCQCISEGMEHFSGTWRYSIFLLIFHDLNWNPGRLTTDVYQNLCHVFRLPAYESHPCSALIQYSWLLGHPKISSCREQRNEESKFNRCGDNHYILYALWLPRLFCIWEPSSRKHTNRIRILWAILANRCR